MTFRGTDCEGVRAGPTIGSFAAAWIVAFQTPPIIINPSYSSDTTRSSWRAAGSNQSTPMRLAASAIPNALLYPILTRRRRAPSKPYKRAAIIKLGKLGDGVLALGAIRSLVEHFGPQHCVIVASAFAVDLFASEFPTVETLTVTTNHSTLRRSLVDLYRHRRHPLFRNGVETLVSLQHHRTLHDDVIASSIPSSFAWGLRNSELGIDGLRDQIVSATFSFDNRTPELPENRAHCRELSLHSCLVSAVLERPISAGDLRPQILVEEMKPLPVIGFAPFSGSVLRDIPMPLLISGCRKAHSIGFDVHIWTPSPDEARATNLAVHLSRVSDAKVTLIHTRTISELLVAISKVSLAVAAESGPAHLATAMNRRLIAILGGGHFGWFAPWARSSRQQWLFSRQPCYSCNWRCVHPEPICITQIGEIAFRRAMDEAFAA